MKRIIYILFIWVVVTPVGVAQEYASHFLFDEFKEGIIYYRNGQQFKAELNYHLGINKFLFVDVADNNQLKEFAEPEEVMMIKMGDQNFIFTNKGDKVQGVLVMEPALLVQYKGKLKAQGKNVGYGGRSETSSIETISTFTHTGQTYYLDNNQMVIYNIEKIYEIAHKNRRKTFKNKSQFLKIFSANKRELDDYIKEHKINFDNPDHVVELVNHARAL